MKENIMKYIKPIHTYWTKRTKVQKGVFIGSFAIVLMLIIGLSFLTNNSKFAPLYTDLSLQEVGQIKGELEARGVAYELENGGTTIKVPEEKVDALIVDLAGQGIPSTGNTDYSFFSENSSWGITDNEFNMIKLDAMQTELANLIKGIEGISDANVMITLPQETVFVSEGIQEASAAIRLDTQPGYQFKGNQVEALYHLVSKAVPNLPRENIMIMNQYSEYFDSDSVAANGEQEEFTYQRSVKKDIEHDIQRRLQQMLGTMVGTESVIVSVTADIDFTKENRVEELVEPVDLENMEGLPVSIESIHETYSGNQTIGGVVGTGEEDIPDYPAVDQGDDGEYELVKETINNEFNRIRKDIVESPFKVRDLGIQVAVNNVLGNNGDEIQYLSQEEQNAVEDGIASILNSMINTSIDKEYGEINADEKISIVFQEFSGTAVPTDAGKPMIPLWMYIVGGILLVAIIVLVIMLVRRRDIEIEEEELSSEEYTSELELDITELADGPETEASIQKKQLEKMAQDKPEEFAKLLKSWIADD
jgi:flagellar M-ring protein FliF